MVKGIAVGLLISTSHLSSEEKKEAKSDFLKLVASTNGNITQKPIDEDELLLQLNQEGADQYELLDKEGKALAIKLAARACNGGNDCKHQNACRTEKNACMGQGECKGQTVCAFSDKNQAVRTAEKLMKEKRDALQNGEKQPVPTPTKSGS